MLEVLRKRRQRVLHFFRRQLATEQRAFREAVVRVVRAISKAVHCLSDQWNTIRTMPAAHTKVTVNSASFVPIVISDPFPCRQCEKYITIEKPNASTMITDQNTCQPGLDRLIDSAR